MTLVEILNALKRSACRLNVVLVEREPARALELVADCIGLLDRVTDEIARRLARGASQRPASRRRTL